MLWALPSLAWRAEPVSPRKSGEPFGPFTEGAEFLAFLDEDDPQRLVVTSLRERGFSE